MACDNPRCEGGWVQVRDSYVERHAPEPDLPDGEGPELDEARAQLVAEWNQRRAALANTWYPCPVCNARSFHFWREGHMDADHDRYDCEICDVPGQRPRRRETDDRPAPVYQGPRMPDGSPTPNPPPPGYKDEELF